MSRKYFLILGLFLVSGFLFLNVNVTEAATYTWTGGGDRVSWRDPANWNIGTGVLNYPGASTTDSVIIGEQTSGATGGGNVVVRATSTTDGTTLWLDTLTIGTGGDDGGPMLIVGNGVTIAASTTVRLVGTSTLKLGDATWGSGTLKLVNANTNVNPFLFGTTTTAFTAATGTVTFTGTGGGIVVATTTYYNLNLTPTSTAAAVGSFSTYRFNMGGSTCTSGGCTATTTVSNVLTINEFAQANFNTIDVVLSGSGTVLSKSKGTFVANGAWVLYTATAATNIATGTYERFLVRGAATKTLLGNTTATTSVQVDPNATLAISTYTFTATGATWLNDGTVTEDTGGKIVLASATQLDDGSGTAKNSFNGDARDTVSVQLTDTSLNLLAATIETQTAAITAVSGIRDVETVTLTETTASSGIFRGGVQLNLSGTNVGGKLDYQGGGTLSYTFTDSQDSSDTGTVGAGSFTGTAPGGGGGGGGGTVAVVVTPAVPATPATPAVPTVAPAVPATPATPATPAVPSLDSVSTKIASVVAKIAALTKSSPAADIAAVQAEIVAILNDIKAIQAAQPAPKGVALGFKFVRPLALGMTHNDVRNLQTALKTDSSVYPEGVVSGYFGPATLKAVKKFQEKYGLASSGTSGYGNVGPKTREKLNELYGGK